MSISAFAVKRYQLTIVVFLMLIGLGISAFLGIPKSEDPTFPIPSFTVVAVYPGSAPTDLEKLVVDPLEEKIKALENLKSLKTDINDGLAVITAEFTAGVDADKKYDDLLREVSAVRPTLPPGLQRLDVHRFNAANVNILQVALVSSSAPYRDLESQADRLKKRIENVAGIKEAGKWAYPAQEVRVALDAARLSTLNLSPQQVIAAIQATNVNIPAGSVDIGRKKFNVKTSGDYDSLQQIEDTVVVSGVGSVVHLSELAKVTIEDADLTYIGRYNGQRAVFVTANQKEGQNIYDTRAHLQPVLDGFAKELPPTIRLELGFDQARNVRHRIGGFLRDFGLAIALVLLTLLPLGFRASLIVMISIPLSLAVGLAMLHLAGFSINQLSIVGFVIALGLLVDDSIVVIENISRFLRLGHPPRDAAILATQQITVSVLGCTATLIFAFLPILYLPGVPGQFIRSLPMAVVFTILASLFVALTIIPFLASLLLKAEGAEGNFFFRLLHRFIEGSYRRVLHVALRNPLLTVALAAALFVGSLGLVPLIGFSLFPKAGIPQFRITVETPDGSSLAETDHATRYAESVLQRHPEVKSFLSSVGEGNPQVYYNVPQAYQQTNIGEVLAQLDTDEPKTTEGLFRQLRAELADYPNAKLELKEFEQGPQLEAPIAIRLIGESFEPLDALALQLEAILQKTPGTLYVRNASKDRKADLRLQIDREKAGLLGIPLSALDTVVRVGLAGVVAGSYRAPGQSDDAYDINVVLPRPPGSTGGQSLGALDRLYLPSQSGANVPLGQIAHAVFEASPTSIHHYNKERSVLVTSDVLPGYNTDKLTKAVLAKLDQIQFPPGYRYQAAGEIESREESFGGLGTAILMAAFGILAILVLEFQTFKGTLIVASVIPLGVVGGLVALFLTHNTLSFTATIGFVALIGIEVKNSILLVDFTNLLRAKGKSVDEAVEEAGDTRFVPILLTTLTALGGLLPLALENSSLYSPLAWVIIGGLVTSTVLTRLVTPVVYKLLAPDVALEVAAAAPSTVVSALPVHG